MVIFNFLGVSPSITGPVENSPTTFKVVQAMLVCTFILFPLSLTKRMSGLRYIALLSVVSMLFVATLIIFELPMYIDKYHNRDDTEIVLANFNFYFFNGCGVIFFSLTN